MKNETDLTNKKMLWDIHTVLLGIPGTDDRGCVGDIKDMKEQLQILGKAVNVNTAWRKAIIWVLGIMLTSGAGTGIFYLVN